MSNVVKRRLLLEEKGFSLAEVMVTMMIMIVVLFALYSLFDMSLRVFSIGNDKVEAVQNARLGLEKMKREIEAAYPYNRTDDITTNDYLFWHPSNPAAPAPTLSAYSITFGNDLNGNYKVDINTLGIPNEQITYNLNGTTLRRTTLDSTGTPKPQPVVEFVQDVDGDGNALTFTYLDANGNTTNNESDVRTVRIKLEVAVDRGIEAQPVKQTLTTDVALRNRGD